jgi:hypothetical protein
MERWRRPILTSEVTTPQEEGTMQRISEIERPGLAVRAFYKVGERLFGKVPTTERVMAHRVPLMLGIGGLWGSMEWFATIERTLRELLQVHVAELRASAY